MTWVSLFESARRDPTSTTKTASSSRIRMASGASRMSAIFRNEWERMPAGAEVTTDGQRWMSSDENHFMMQVPVRKRLVDVSNGISSTQAAD